VGGTGSSPEIAFRESEAGVMTSHEYANKLKELSDFLLAKPEFDFYSNSGRIRLYFGSSKEKFIKAAKALGSVTKTYKDGDIEVAPVDHPIFVLYANRDTVCRKVQEEKWECEPLLSQAEEAEIGA
jgi:hypothetical protein